MHIFIPPALTDLHKRQHTLYTIVDLKKNLTYTLKAFYINAQCIFILYSCIIFHLVTISEFT